MNVRNLRDAAEHAKILVQQEEKFTYLKGGDGGGTFDDMEARLSRVEDAIAAIRSSQDRVEQRFEAVHSDTTEIKISQVRVQERMERVMDRARDMPTPTIVDGMITSKLGLSALLLTGAGVLIAAITYAVS